MSAFRRAGFTLLEICLALAIGLLIIMLSVPGIAGLLAEQRLKKSFERFSQLVTTAHLRSVTEQRTYRLVWEKRGISVVVAEDVTRASVERLIFGEGEDFQLRRTASLVRNPPNEWTFWRNGTCEPAQVAFQGAAGSWLVEYDPLLARATFVKSDVR